MATGTYHARAYILGLAPEALARGVTAREIHQAAPPTLTETAIKAACSLFAADGFLEATEEKRDGVLVYRVRNLDGLAKRRVKGDKTRAMRSARPRLAAPAPAAPIITGHVAAPQSTLDAVLTGCVRLLRESALALEMAPRLALEHASDEQLVGEILRRGLARMGGALG